MKKKSFWGALIPALVTAALAAALCWVVYTYRDTLLDLAARLLTRAEALVNRMKALFAPSREEDDEFADL